MKTASIILRYRWFIVAFTVLLTGIMFVVSRRAEMSYQMGEILPKEDSVYQDYQQFRKIFGEEANVMIIAVDDPDFFSPKHLARWRALEDSIHAVPHVNWVLSIASAINLERNDSLRKFDVKPIVSQIPASESEGIALKNKVLQMPFYQHLLFNSETESFVMLASLDKSIVHSKERIAVVSEVRDVIERYEQRHGVDLHISGLPFIRTDTILRSQKEIVLFVGLAALITAIILLLFFRSFAAIFVPLVVVAMGVIWSSATLVIFGYKITTLTGLIPPLLIVIGIPNAVYMITKYHQEFKKHQNKIRALSRVIEKTGKAIFLTNLTTAVGFGTLIITNSKLLVEFGVVAFINVILLFLLSLLLIPTLLSFFPAPTARHLRHLERKGTNYLAEKLTFLVREKRRIIYATAVVVVSLSIWGITRIKTSGKVADDVPQHSETYADLTYFEDRFTGVLPLEVMVNTGKPGGANANPKLWKKVSALQDSIFAIQEFSKPISFIELIKFANQAYYKGDPEAYELPSSLDLLTINSFVRKSGANDSLTQSYMDSSKQYIRIRAQMADIGTYQMKGLIQRVNQQVGQIFPDSSATVTLTGASVVILKGTEYLVNNLFSSLLIAIMVIAGIMAGMFKNIKMVAISLIPNLIPLLFTAGAMGILGVPLKASTCLIFSVAFGISVDDTIHYLSRYRMELKIAKGDVRRAVFKALEETGLSMAYTSTILFFGFSIFILSDFGGTKALGMLVSMTLLIAMFTNLIVLPSLLLSWNRTNQDDDYEVYSAIEEDDEPDETNTNLL